MRVALRSNHAVRHCLLAFSLLMVGVALVLFSQIQRLSSGTYDMVTLELLDGANDLPLELRALEAELWRAVDTGSVEAVRLAYDIAWNRFDILTKSGTLRGKLHAVDSSETIESISVRYFGLDPAVADLVAGDRNMIRAIAAEIGAIRSMAMALNVRIHQIVLAMVAETRRDLQRLYWAFGLTILLTALSVGLLTWVLIRTIRDLDRSNGELAAVSRELDEALRQSQAANKAKTDFLAVMSHELRTPLNAVIGFAEFMGMLGSKITDERRDEYLQSIATSGRHLLALVNQVLHFSKVESGTSALHEEEFPVAVMLKEAAEVAVAGSAEQGGCVIVDDLAEDLRMWADQQAIRQMLLNLLVNARKFSPPGSDIHLRVLRSERGELGLQVADYGPGMTEAEIALALQPFGQVAGAHTRSHGGVGLGLPITVKLIEQHGGRLQIDSAPGTGCRVTLWVPADRVVLPDTDRAAA